MLKAIFAAALLAASAVQAAGDYRVLYRFQGDADGGEPGGSLIRDAAGNLYGVAIAGGEGRAGIVFKLSPQGVKTTLHAFGRHDGVSPVTPLLLDEQGALFGLTETGGSYCNDIGCGIAYEIAPDGSARTLHAFKPAQGSFPVGGLVANASGNLFGTLYQDGPTRTGTLFRLSPQGSFKLLHAFDGDTEGSRPHGLIAGRKGNLYGVTSQGGPANSGTAFRYAPDGTVTVLHGFLSGESPAGQLARDGSGNLYGVLALSGPGRNGSIYRLARDGTFTTLYAFTGGADGSQPISTPVLDRQGNIYGTMRFGPGDRTAGAECEDSCGAVYELAADGTLSVIHAFANDAGGYYPMDDLLLDRRRLIGATFSGGVPGGQCADGCGVIYAVGVK